MPDNAFQANNKVHFEREEYLFDIFGSGLACFIKQVLTGQQHGVLLQRLADLIRLPGQRTLIYLQVIALDQNAVSRKQVSCRSRYQRMYI